MDKRINVKLDTSRTDYYLKNNLSLKYLISNKGMKLPRLGFCEKNIYFLSNFPSREILQITLLKGVFKYLKFLNKMVPEKNNLFFRVKK